MNMQVAFIGLGTMGAAMAANLVKAGHQVRGWNRSPEPVATLAAAGGVAAASAVDAARGAEVLITMLADDQATRAVVDAQVLGALAQGAIHVNMATVSLAFTQEMVALHAAHGVGYLAAPVLGRVNVAREGKLQIVAAGDAALLDRVQPLFDVMGQKTWRFGDRPEQAAVVKLGVNFMIAGAIEAMGEASALAQSQGVAKTDFIDMVTSTLFAVPVYRGYGMALASGQFEPPGFKLSLGYKDVRLALEAAGAGAVPMPFASLLRDNLLDSLAHGEGNQDLAALGKVAARRANQG
ncbi:MULTISPECIES: NAD(P)-dependent oxidoreductase [unclassified Cupriavidus]|uniref:NAD(P)-dependent oxidoreductase n=1 Tax=Cupriavidus sp. H19C3 TaxID=3241603 RepID=UPI003BF7C7B5